LQKSRTESRKEQEENNAGASAENDCAARADQLAQDKYSRGEVSFNFERRPFERKLC